MTIARATATRCCWPPESSRADAGHGRPCRPRAAPRPAWRSLRRARRRRAAVRRCDRGRAGTRLKLWKTKPILRLRRSARSSSSSCADVGAIDQVAAAARHVEAAEDVHERALAGPRAAHDRHEVAALDAQRHAAQRRHLDLAQPVDLGDPAHVDHRMPEIAAAQHATLFACDERPRARRALVPARVAIWASVSHRVAHLRRPPPPAKPPTAKPPPPPARNAPPVPRVLVGELPVLVPVLSLRKHHLFSALQARADQRGAVADQARDTFRRTCLLPSSTVTVEPRTALEGTFTPSSCLTTTSAAPLIPGLIPCSS